MTREKKASPETKTILKKVPKEIYQNPFYWLSFYGHFDNPEKLEAKDFKQRGGNFNRLRLKDPPAKQAIQSLQELDVNFHHFCKTCHGRRGNADGEIGPATIQLMNHPRCQNPDYSTLQNNLNDYISWPVPGCDPKDPNRSIQSGVRFMLNEERASPIVKAYLPKAIKAAQYCTAEMGCWTRQVYDINEAELYSAFEVIFGAVVGWNEVPRNPHCNLRVNGRLDENFITDWKKFTTLLIHELFMHGFGFGHTRGGIGNPSIILGEWRETNGVLHPTWYGDPHEDTYIGAFGGKWADLDAPLGEEDDKPEEDWRTVHQWELNDADLEMRFQIRDLEKNNAKKEEDDYFKL